MTAEQPATILARMVSAGMTEQRARHHLAAGTVHVAGRVVTDPDERVPHPEAWVIGPG